MAASSDLSRYGKIAEGKLRVLLLETQDKEGYLFNDADLVSGLPFDMVVCNRHKQYFNVQVKSRYAGEYKNPYNNSVAYHITVAHAGYGKTKSNHPCVGPYTENEFDILSVYLHDLDVWYHLPYYEIHNKASIYLFPHGRQAGLYKNSIDAEHYRNNLSVFDDKVALARKNLLTQIDIQSKLEEVTC